MMLLDNFELEKELELLHRREWLRLIWMAKDKALVASGDGLMELICQKHECPMKLCFSGTSLFSLRASSFISVFTFTKEIKRYTSNINFVRACFCWKTRTGNLFDTHCPRLYALSHFVCRLNPLTVCAGANCIQFWKYQIILTFLLKNYFINI